MYQVTFGCIWFRWAVFTYTFVGVQKYRGLTADAPSFCLGAFIGLPSVQALQKDLPEFYGNTPLECRLSEGGGCRGEN